jgi:tripartite-type tricarboxylate transporter receptor subunit TctC
MNKRFAFITGVLLLVVLAAAGCPSPAGPVAPADFYRGKTVDLITTGTTGSFNDLVDYIIASYLGEDIEGNVILTDRRGAGGLEGTNYVYKAEPDGLTLGAVASVKFITNKVMDEPVAEYELDKFAYIMSIDRQPYCLLVAPEGPYQSIADLQAATDLKIGGTSPSGPISLGGLTVIKLLGLDAKVVTGFPDIASLPPAVGRGEIAGYCLSISNAKASIDSGLVKPLFLLSTERNPLAPSVPAITELVSSSGEDLAMAQLWGTTLSASELLIAPPGLAADRLAFLRGLANQWAQDEAFRAEVNQAANYEVQVYLTGDQVSQAMLEMAANLDQFQAIFADLIERYRA